MPTRPVIAASWRRASLSGLHPGIRIDSSSLAAVNRGSRLMQAAGPVLDDVAMALEGTDFVVALADREPRLVDVRCSRPNMRVQLERLGLVAGRAVGEEAIGTNAIATAVEVGGGVTVHGDEHFIESLKQFSCVGYPIYHPATRRLEGVLDVSCATTEMNPLLAPFLARVSRQIEMRLLAAGRGGDRLLLEAFQLASVRDRGLPVVALGMDVFLANEAGVEILTAGDHAVLRDMALDASGMRGRPQLLRLGSGRVVMASVVPVADGALFTFETAHRGPVDIGTVPVDISTSVAVCGEPGSGCTSAAREVVAGRGSAKWVDASDIVTHGERAWLSQLHNCLAGSTNVVIESVHVMPPRMARCLVTAMRETAARTVLTSVPVDQLDGEIAGMVAGCMEHIELKPLRSRRDEIPALVASILAELDAPRELRFTPAVFEALAGQPWPGNLRELRTVVQHVIDTRGVGDVAVHDLPERYRSRARSRVLTPMEQAERGAIVVALRSADGNKQAAAVQLGISRTTLYRAIRRYGIVAPVFKS